MFDDLHFVSFLSDSNFNIILFRFTTFLNCMQYDDNVINTDELIINNNNNNSNHHTINEINNIKTSYSYNDIYEVESSYNRFVVSLFNVWFIVIH